MYKRQAQDIPSEIAVIRLVPARKDWNDVLRQQGDIPSRKFIAETITLRELPTAQPVPMLRMADVDMNRANEVRPIFRSLGDIAQATGCAIVLIGHLNKAAGTQSTYRAVSYTHLGA